jgi:lipase chaperone LimK
LLAESKTVSVREAPDQEPNSSRPTSLTETLNQIPSLAGTQVNGRIREDANGELVVDRDLRRLFDYFLTLRGLYPQDFVDQLITDYMAQFVGDKASAQARQLLEQYQSYQADTKSMVENADVGLSVEDMRYLVDQRQHIRREHFDDETVAAFFGDLERYEEHQLEAMRIGLDPYLSPAERQRQLEQNDARLPSHMYENRRRTFRYNRLKSALEQAGSQSEVMAKVAEQYGDKAAERMRQVEREHQQWQAKVKAALARKQQIYADESLYPEEQDAMWERYQVRTFTATERRRFEALALDQSDIESVADSLGH